MRALFLSLLALLLAALFTAPVRAAEPRPAAAAGLRLSPEKHRRAVEYARAGYRLYFAGALYGLLILGGMVRARLGARLRRWAELASARRRFVQLLVYIPLLIIIISILFLPLDLYGHVLSRAYDQSVQGWGSWAWDFTKARLLAIALAVPLAWLLFAVIRRSPRRWWLWFWAASVPLVLLLQFLAPTVIEPLFFHFEPLAPRRPELAAALEREAARGGLTIPRARMFEMQASEKLKSVNAYVSGFGASQRVVVWDTTIAAMTTPEIMFVFGHEMGHYVLHHIAKGIAFALALLLISLYIVFRAMKWARRDPGDLASLPLLLLIFSSLSLVATPIGSGFSRHQEHQADIFGLELIHGLISNAPETAAQAFQTLGEIDLADPAPGEFIQFWLYSHPALGARIDFARGYDPWSRGEAPRYLR